MKRTSKFGIQVDAQEKRVTYEVNDHIFLGVPYDL